MKTFEQKVEELAKLKDRLVKSRLTVFTSFARAGQARGIQAGQVGLNVAQMRELKNSLKGVDSEYVVGKKTILDRALRSVFQGRGPSPDVFAYEGSMGVAFGYGNEAASAKSIYNFAKKNPALKFFGALLGDRFIDDQQFIELAKLPARDVMISHVVGMIKCPLSGLINVLQANIRNLVGVLGQIAMRRDSRCQ